MGPTTTSPSTTTPGAPTTSFRTFAGRSMLLVAALPASLAAFGWWGDPGLVWTHRLGPFVLGVVAMLCLAVALGLLPSGWSVRAPLLVLCGIAIALWSLLGLVVGSLSTQLAVLSAPPGSPYEAVAVSYGVGKVVTVRQTGLGLGSRQWDAACLRDDSGEARLEGLRWAGRDRLQVSTSSGPGVIEVDPTTGEPSAVSGALLAC